MAEDGDEKIGDKIKNDMNDDEDLMVGEDYDSDNEEESSEGGLFDNIAQQGKDKLQEKIKEGLEKSKDNANRAADDMDKLKQGTNKSSSGGSTGPDVSDKAGKGGEQPTQQGSGTNAQPQGSQPPGTGAGSNAANTGTNTANTGANAAGTGANTAAAGAEAGTAGAGTGAAAGASAAGGATAGGAAAGGAAAGGTAATAGTAAATAGAAAGGIAAGWVILIIVAVIIIIMLIIGMISFFVDGIGLISGRLKEIAESFWGWFVGAEQVSVDQEDIIDAAGYLESMGYDLVNYGFLNSNGEYIVKDDSEEGYVKYKRKSDGHEILKRTATKSEDGAVSEGEIVSIESDCLKAYLVSENMIYMITNNTWSWKGFFEMLFNEDDATEGVGLVAIDGDSQGLIKHAESDAKTKKMTIETKNGYKYSYDLDGWTGRYGKSLEFLLTLHLATMAPDFATEVAMSKKIETEVRIGLYEVDASIKLLYLDEDDKYNLPHIVVDGNKYIEITKDNYATLRLTDEQWEAINSYNSDDVKTVTPYIRTVKNHWFRNLDFDGCYATRDNDPNSEEDDADFTRVYQYVGLGEDDDLLASLDNLYVYEQRKKDIFQISEPKEIDNSAYIKSMLLGAKFENGRIVENTENTEEKYQYFIYDGAPLVNEDDTRPKRYIIQKVNFNDIDSNGETTSKYAMDTKMFQYAFAILESTHTQDAEYVLRDLKELFESLGISTEVKENDDLTDVEPFKWLIPEYIPPVWDPMFNSNETMMKIKHAEGEGIRGFEDGLEVVMPVKGKIVKIIDGEKEETNADGTKTMVSDGTKSIKIEITDERYEGISLTIGGIKLDDSIKEGQIIDEGERIGETTNTEIFIIMTNKDKTPITNVDSYICPPDKKDHSDED